MPFRPIVFPITSKVVEYVNNMFREIFSKVGNMANGILSCNDIRGGTLTLGGTDNANGVAMIKDSTGADRIRFANNGLDFYDSLGAVTANISTTTENKTITVGVGKDFTTIQAAIDSLPKIINHDIAISVFTGTYAERLLIIGFSGSGRLTIGKAVASSVTIYSAYINSCRLRLVGLREMTFSNPTPEQYTIEIISSSYVSLYSISNASTNDYGISYFGSIGNIDFTQISNKTYAAVTVRGSSVVTISGLSGSGNGNIAEARDGVIFDGGGHTLTSSTFSIAGAGVVIGNSIITNGGELDITNLAKLNAANVFTQNQETKVDNARFSFRRAAGLTGSYAGFRVYDDTTSTTVPVGVLFYQFSTGKWQISFDGGSTYFDIITANGGTFADAVNLAFGTTTGTKIGTAEAQKIGFWNVTPVVRPSAFTQTYATADKTHAARTAAALTNNTGGTISTTLAAITAGTTYAQADLTAIKNALASLADQINKLRNDSNDTAQCLNSAIDDLQNIGLLK
jgi:hypothetical protein